MPIAVQDARKREYTTRKCTHRAITMWLETITLRTSSSLRGKLERELVSTLSGNTEIVREAIAVSVYVRDGSTTDLSVHYRHTEQVPVAGSRCGCRLAETLRAYGIVDHAVWQLLG